ncbi:hypothetical protein ACOLZ1_000007 [Vibrio fluvialis]
MGSEYLKRFENGFTLDEISLRKLRDIISSRVKDKEIDFLVKRSDGFSYQTTDVEQLIESENSSWIDIKSISIIAGHYAYNVKDPVTYINLDFSKKDVFTTGLKVAGNDKDIVNLLGEDLNSYLKAKILKKKSKALSYLFLLGVCLILLATFLLAIASYAAPEPIDLTTKLHTMSDQQKLDYIIMKLDGKEKESPSSVAFGVLSILTVVTLFVAIVYEGSISKVKNKYFPRCSFLFGNELISYQKIHSIKKNIFWCVIVASIVSFVTGLMVWHFTGN